MVEDMVLLPNLHSSTFVILLFEKVDLGGTTANQDLTVNQEHISKVLPSDHLQLVRALCNIWKLVVEVSADELLAPPGTDRYLKTLALSIEAIHQLVHLIVKAAEWKVETAAVESKFYQVLHFTRA